MISETQAYAALLATLAFLVWIGLGARRKSDTFDDFVTARGTQDGAALGLSFFASGMGAWILFAPPEVGAFVGLVGVLGYGLAAAAPFALFAFIGPRVRRFMPEGRGLIDFVAFRYGRGVQLYVVALSILYMFVFVIAELTAVGGIVSILSGVDPRPVVVAVAVATLLYTTIGGLRASLRTDSWQAWMVLALVAAAAAAIFNSAAGGPGLDATPLMSVSRFGLEAAATLVIAVTAANLFHQGYWQRMWAAAGDRALVSGARIGAALSLPVTILCGAFGLLAVGRGLDLGTPPLPFFALLGALPDWVGVAVVILGVALVASSIDTLQNALGSLVSAERHRVSAAGARIATVAFMIPASVVAFQGHSVLRIFLVADLLCTTAVVPLLLGLWRRTSTAAALRGCIAGVLGALLPGGLEAATFPGAVPTLGPFLGALGASAAVSLALIMASWTRTTSSASTRFN